MLRWPYPTTIASVAARPTSRRRTMLLVGLLAWGVSIPGQALAAGAIEISPVTDYDYGYRQGELQDPFGHHWLIEKVI